MKAKICGVKDEKTLRFILEHKYPPDFIGFISNFPKSKRFIEIDKLKYLTNINRKNVKFVAVLVDPSDEILEKIKNFNFDYYQLYAVRLERNTLIGNHNIQKISPTSIK